MAALRLPWFSLALSLGLWTPTASHAAQAIPEALNGSPIQVQRQYVRQAGEQSLREKIAVGRQRTEERRQYRRALVANIRTHAVERERQISAFGAAAPAATSAPAQAAQPARPQLARNPAAWTGGLAALSLGLALWAFRRRRDAASGRQPNPRSLAAARPVQAG
jgi:hypothetical protein